MELYEYQKEVARYLRTGQSVILQAPTGAGKTIAALWPFLEAWDRNKADIFPHKCIYSVPMRTLANQFLDKATDLIEKEMLLTQNPVVTIQTGVRAEDQKLEGDLIFTTIDQTLSNFLGIPYALSNGQANLNAGAVAAAYLVFDEFHLYGPEAMQTTILMLKQLKGIIPFLLMTATFSTTMLDELCLELDPDQTGDVVVIPNSEPQWLAMQALKSQQKIRRYHIVEDTLKAETVLARHAQPQVQRSIAICNTVDRAQTLFDEITSQKPPGVEVRLLHSRFYQDDRIGHENELRREFGEERKQRNQESMIFVATQVIEVGLDITCEVLHTELAPANSVLQRAGRCARYEGEMGEVYVYQLPVDDEERPKYAPYHELAQKDICRHSWAALAKRNGEVLTFSDELDVLQEAHGEDDKRQIEELRDNRFIHEDMMAEAMGYQERRLVRELIRNVNNKNITVRPDLEDKSDDENPWQWESFSLYTGSVYKAYQDLRDKALEIGHLQDEEDEENWVMLRLFQREDPEETETPKIHYWWRKVTAQDQLEGALLVAVHPHLAKYTAAAGLQLGVENNETWEPRKRNFFPKPNQRHQSQRESYLQHIERLFTAYQTAQSRFHPSKREMVMRQAVQSDMAHAFARMEQKFQLPAGTLDKAVRFVIAGHDFGKLGKKWQAWMHRWQEHELINNPASADLMLARPDNDGSDEQYKAQQSLHPKRPNHAAESAFGLLDVTRAWCNSLEGVSPRIKDALYRGINTAITRHHAASHIGTVKDPFIIDPHGEAALRQAFESVGWLDLDFTDIAWTFDEDEAEDLTYLLVEPDKPTQMLFYMLLSRVLRLTDQRAASQK